MLSSKIFELRQHNPSSFSSLAHRLSRLSRRPLQKTSSKPFSSLPKKIEICGRLFAKPKNHQKTHPSKTSQNLKKLDHGRPMARFDDLLEQFGHPFFIKFRIHPNLLNFNAKLVFYPVRPLIFGTEHALKFMFFRDTLPDFTFPHFMLIFSKRCDFGTHL